MKNPSVSSSMPSVQCSLASFRIDSVIKNSTSERSSLEARHGSKGKHAFLNRYEMLSTVSRSRFAVVRELETGNTFFLKIWVKEVGEVDSGTNMTLMDEHYLFKTLNDENLCNCHDIVETLRSVYQLIEYHPISLAHICEERLSLKDIGSLFMTLVNGVKYLESMGMTHFDLCPSKVRISENQETGERKSKIGSFSRILQTQYCLNENLPFTDICFVAPEAREINCTFDGFKASVYSLGCILNYMLSRKRPSLERMAEYIDLSDRISELGKAEFAEGLESLIQNMCCEEPEERISVSDVLENKLLNEAFQTQLLNTIPEASSIS
eukprot:Nk52_evm4s39 gene=Nk52_evmTU4s39